MPNDHTQPAEIAHVRFERIGRNRNVPDMPISGDPTNLDNVAAQAFDHARKHLGSKWFDVTVDEAGTVLIEYGRFGRGVVLPPATTDERCCPGAGSMAHVRGCINHPEAGR